MVTVGVKGLVVVYASRQASTCSMVTMSYPRIRMRQILFTIHVWCVYKPMFVSLKAPPYDLRCIKSLRRGELTE